MGAPSNQQELRTAHDVLRDMLRGPEHRLDESDLRTTGVDVDMLEATCETNIRPYLDYLHGYSDLKQLDPLSGHRPTVWDSVADRTIPKESWEQLLGRFGQLKQHRQALRVAGGKMYWYNRDWSGPSNITVAVFLTRKGKWLFWYVEGRGQHSDQYSGERISVHGSIRALWEAIQPLVPDGFTFEFYGYGRRRYVPLTIEQGLQDILQATITEREERLGKMQAALQVAVQRTSLVISR